MHHSLVAALSFALLQPAAPALAPAPAAQPAPVAVQPAAPPVPAQPAAPAQPYAQPTPPEQPYAQPLEPTQPYPPPSQPQGGPPNTYSPETPPATTTTPPAGVEGPANAPESVTHRKLVFANFYALNFGILSPFPSGDFSFFLGTNLRPRKNRARTFDWNTALGYQLTLSVGLADEMSYELSPVDDYNIFIHRHHLTAMGYGGQKQRLFYSMGAGVAFLLSQIGGVEGEGRLGYVFSKPERRIKGVVGGQARITAAFGGVPLLQLGPFIGFMTF
ncbi:hypothetical protein [Nannocystis punicea]|uniref:Outer membrane protein beta-barrel domain-containing protein n=1 Tax=Nannocystis punicea TaxID=2995304 RepID=A0ABY7GTU0_9BACT|nr:hypothetical protein [Nannocystis poenicansa]WAS90387.1 hypothetical protein O0S08_29720 [Nannocystis poenicansa]